MKRITLLSLLILIFFLGCVTDSGLPTPWDGLPASQQLLIMSPSDGDTITLNSTTLDTSDCTIKWYYRGSKTTFSRFDLYLMQHDSIVSYIDSVSSLSYNSKNWEPSEHFYGNNNLYRVLMRDRVDSSIVDTSDYFSIISPYEGSYDISVELVNDSYSEYVEIDWVTTGATGSRITLDLYKDSEYLFKIVDSLKDTSGYYWTTPSSKIVTDSTYQIKISSIMDKSITAISDSLSLTGLIVNDSFEEDNILSSAKSIVVSESQERTNYLGDFDWVKMDLEAGKSYRLTSRGCSKLGIRIYGENSSEVLYADTSTSDPEILFDAEFTGTYHALVYRHWISSSSSFDATYTLSLQEYDPTQALFFTYPLSDDTLPVGKNISMTWNELKSIGNNYHIGLYSDTTLVYTIESYTLITGNAYSWGIPTWTEEGMYRFKVTGAQYETLFGFSDSFYIQGGMLNDSYESNNTRETATDMVIDSVLQGALTVGDIDWFTIPVTAGFTYAFETDPTEKVRVSLLNSSEEIIRKDSLGILMTFRHQTVKNDTLLIVIDAGGNDNYRYYGGNYSLTVSKADSDSLVQFTEPNSNSFYDINTSQLIEWEAPVLGDVVSIELFKNGKYLYRISRNTSNNGQYMWDINSGLETGDDYQFKLITFPEVITHPDASAYGFSKQFAINGLLPDTFEVDHSSELASEYKTFGIKDTHTLPIGDTDWVKFPIEPNYYYITRITSDLNCKLEVYETNPLEYLSFINIESTTRSYTYSSDIKDSLYISLSGYESEGGAYEIAIDKISKDSLISVTYPNANSILSAGDTYEITWDAPILNSKVYIRLYKGESNVGHLTNIPNTGSINWNVNGSYATGTDYRFKISKYGDSSIYTYSDYFTISGISEDLYEPDNNRTNASLITVNSQEVQQRTISFNDTDWVTIPMIKDSLYSISVEETSSNEGLMNIQLYNDLSASPLDLATGTKNLWLCETSGTYFARLSAGRNTPLYYGGYELSVQEFGSEYYSVEVTVPNDTLTINSTGSTITWTNADYIGTAVDLFLYKDGTVVSTVISDVQTSGTYQWIIPSSVEIGDGYSIKVVSRWKNELQGESEPFTIN